ncbi:MAG: type II toxin-antitoxin system Phd/YefM family antitoxin [Actinomycetota bacterium]
MIEVGIRDLRNRLSHYLKRVRSGETIKVTDHGEPVAQIIPAGIDPHLAKMIAEGRLTWSGKRLGPLPKPVKPLKPGPSLSDYITEDREAGF